MGVHYQRHWIPSFISKFFYLIISDIKWTAMFIVTVLCAVFAFPTFYQFIKDKPTAETTQPKQKTENNNLQGYNTISTIHSQPPIQPKQLTPAEKIISEIEAVPPLQRKDMSKAYVGIPVDWELFFLHGAPEKNNKYYLMFSSTPTRKGIYIKCYVPREGNSELIRVTENTKLKVQGKIASIDGGDIYIKNVSVSKMASP